MFHSLVPVVPARRVTEEEWKPPRGLHCGFSNALRSTEGAPWGCWPRGAVRRGPTCGKSLLSEGAGHVGRRRLDQVENSIFSSPSLSRQAGSAHRTLAGGTVAHPAGLGAWARKGCTWDEEGWGRRLSKSSFPHCFVAVVYALRCAWLSGRVSGKHRPLALKGRDLGARSVCPLTPPP